jgi:ATP-binding protein involved in chromosome partitioning
MSSRDQSDSPGDALSALAATLTGGRAGGLRQADGRITLTLETGGLSPAERDAMAQRLKEGLLGQPGVSDVRVALLATRQARRLIAVGSGKGGVGKSTLTTNLAVALRGMGHAVGIVDADIYGPSQPKLLASDTRPEARDDKLVPITSPYGVPFLSMGLLAEPGQAIAWRGPMAGRALEQMVDAHWGDVDTLLVDLPPGTGDIQISMLQKFRPAGAVIVSTPQDLALIDAARAMGLFHTAGVPIIGMVENMAGYVCPHCGETSDPFGSGGAEREAAQAGLPFLGRIPLDRAIRLASDAGVPSVAQGDDGGAPYRSIAAQVSAWLKERG